MQTLNETLKRAYDCRSDTRDIFLDFFFMGDHISLFFLLLLLMQIWIYDNGFTLKPRVDYGCLVSFHSQNSEFVGVSESINCTFCNEKCWGNFLLENIEYCKSSSFFNNIFMSGFSYLEMFKFSRFQSMWDYYQHNPHLIHS